MVDCRLSWCHFHYLSLSWWFLLVVVSFSLLVTQVMILACRGVIFITCHSVDDSCLSWCHFHNLPLTIFRFRRKKQSMCSWWRLNASDRRSRNSRKSCGEPLRPCSENASRWKERRKNWRGRSNWNYRCLSVCVRACMFMCACIHSLLWYQVYGLWVILNYVCVCVRVCVHVFFLSPIFSLFNTIFFRPVCVCVHTHMHACTCTCPCPNECRRRHGGDKGRWLVCKRQVAFREGGGYWSAGEQFVKEFCAQPFRSTNELE